MEFAQQPAKYTESGGRNSLNAELIDGEARDPKTIAVNWIDIHRVERGPGYPLAGCTPASNVVSAVMFTGLTK